MELVERDYFDFNMTHCLEKLRANHGLQVKYETFRKWCHEKKLVKKNDRKYLLFDVFLNAPHYLYG